MDTSLNFSDSLLDKNQNLSKKWEKQINTGFIIIAVVLLVSFLLGLFYLPLIRIFSYAFNLSMGTSTETPPSFFSVIFQPLNLGAIIFSFKQAFISMLFCVVLGIPAGYFISHYKFLGKRFFVNALTIPFILPPIVVLFGFIITYGDQGWLNLWWIRTLGNGHSLIKLYGTSEGIILVHIFYNLSVIIRMSIPAWELLDYDQVHVAQTLGARPFLVFRKVIWPQIKNYILSAAIMVFIYCFNSFAIAMYLGEAKLQTIEVRIYKFNKNCLLPRLQPSKAILQLLFNTAFIILYLWLEKHTRQMAENKESQFIASSFHFKNTSWVNCLKQIGAILYLLAIGFFSFSPLIAVIILSFTPFGPGISPFWGYQQLFSSTNLNLLGTSTLNLIKNTLLFATCATIITIFISLLIVFILRNRFNRINNYRTSIVENVLNFSIILPMATSSITLAVGLFLQFKSTALYTSQGWILIILCHALISIPFATRAIMASYNRIDLELLNVASTLGASRLRIFWKIELPLIRKGLLVGAIFVFAISIGEFGATSFLARADFSTLSLGIGKLLSSRTLQLPASMATILLLITFLSFYIINVIGGKNK